MRQRYDAVVVGSGFGGAVAACRLAQAGQSVAVLERGRRYALGEFPRDWSDPLNGWLWPEKQGLFDVRPFNEMTIVQGAAYGGGSHLYANVHLRLPPDVFEQGWPSGYRRAVLDPYYDLVAYMLDITPISADQPLGLPVKTKRMREVADRLGRADQFCYPTIAVNFGDPTTLRPNKFGVPQYGCRHCGECDIGCNYQSKNTLDLNYLAVAERHGAEVGTRCEVTRITPTNRQYEVLFTDHAAGEERRVQAPVVILAGGAVNTTELLLRCRDQYRTLPKLSDRLGHDYSGNGDFLGFAFDTADPWVPSVGPTITTGIVYDRGTGPDRRWFIFEEGGFPHEIAGLLRVLVDSDDRFAGLLRSHLDGLDAVRRAARDRLAGQPSGEDIGKHTAVFLAMGRDSADGRIELLPISHQLRVTWNLRENLGLYGTEQRFCADVAKALGGDAAYNPLWRLLRLPVSVHNLGGAVMADDAKRGVTDGSGQVFGYPNLYVLDGACLPSATGVNPSHTIAAVAERNIETVIRRVTSHRRWVAPERERTTRVTDPLMAVRIPSGGTAPPRTSGTGLTYTETMRGVIYRGATDPEHPPGRRDWNGEARCDVWFRIDVATPFLDDFLSDPAHPMTAVGTLGAVGFTSPEGARVGGGVVNPLVAGPTPTSRRFLYSLPFFGKDGRPYLLDGYKDVRDHGHFDVWGSTTTLYTRIRRGHRPDGEVLAAGVLRLHPLDFAWQLMTARVTGTDNPLRKAEALAQFSQLFAGSIWDVFVRPRVPLLPPPQGESDDQIHVTSEETEGEAVPHPRRGRDQGRVSGRRSSGVAGRSGPGVRPR